MTAPTIVLYLLNKMALDIEKTIATKKG